MISTREVSSPDCYVIIELLDDENLLIPVRVSHPLRSHEHLYKNIEYGHALMVKVAKKLKIIDYKFFGLQYINKEGNKEQSVRDPSAPAVTRTPRSIFGCGSCNPRKHDDPILAPTYRLSLAVKFYPVNPTSIQDAAIKYQLFLQIRRDILNGRIQLDEEEFIRCCGLILQSDCGDYFGCNLDDHVRKILGLANISTMLEERIRQSHVSFQGRVPALVEFQLLDTIKSHHSYGAFEYSLRLHKTQSSCSLRILPSGVEVVASVMPTLFFKWSDIVAFDRTRSKVILKAYLDGRDFELKFHANKTKEARAIFHTAQENLFYRRMNPEQQQLRDEAKVSGSMNIPQVVQEKIKKADNPNFPINPYRVITKPVPVQKPFACQSMDGRRAPSETNASVWTDPVMTFHERQLLHRRREASGDRSRGLDRPPPRMRRHVNQHRSAEDQYRRLHSSMRGQIPQQEHSVAVMPDHSYPAQAFQLAPLIKQNQELIKNDLPVYDEEADAFDCQSDFLMYQQRNRKLLSRNQWPVDAADQQEYAQTAKAASLQPIPYASHRRLLPQLSSQMSLQHVNYFADLI